ncbi:Accessory secretory protein Asp4, partial [Streptococcus agalactiae GB00899]
KNLLQESINKRLSEERYQIPKEKREKKRFDMQLILIISILIGLIMSIIGIIRFFLTYSS